MNLKSLIRIAGKVLPVVIPLVPVVKQAIKDEKARKVQP